MWSDSGCDKAALSVHQAKGMIVKAFASLGKRNTYIPPLSLAELASVMCDANQNRTGSKETKMREKAFISH